MTERRRWRLGALQIYCLAAVLIAGCGRAQPWGTVSGQVSLEGQPAREVVVFFSCPERGVEMATITDQAGDFRLRTAKVDGLPVGEYRVAILPAIYQKPEDGMTFKKMKAGAGAAGSKIERTHNIPMLYRDPQTSGLTATVKEGNNHFPLILKATPGEP